MTAKDPKCIPCESLDDSFILSEDQIKDKIAALAPLWMVESRENISSTLVRSFVTKNFQSALDCINAIGRVAEEESHHPDLHITNYRNVEVVIYTHKLNGVTENDISLAKLIDERVKIDYSPKWLKENPEARYTRLAV
jgi:4a-hydroxytetrahydrobiopterin dehydratase